MGLVLIHLLLGVLLLVAGGIVFLLYGPTRAARPMVLVPRASLTWMPLPAAAHVVSLAPPIAHPAPAAAGAPAPATILPTIRPAHATFERVPSRLPPGLAPVINHRSLAVPRGRIARGTGAPQVAMATTEAAVVCAAPASPIARTRRPAVPPPVSRR